MSEEKVSIIIPSYNSAAWVCEAIDACRRQTHRNLEIIVIDDGSTDNTRDLIRRTYGLGNSPRDRIRYFQQENMGLAAARNAGIRRASGRYVQFLDADDLITEDKVASQVQQLAGASRLGISISDYRRCDIDDIAKSHGGYLPPRVSASDPLHDIIARWEVELSIPIHCGLFDGRIFREHGIRFDETLPNHEDWDFWVRVLTLRPLLFHVDSVMALYRIRPDSMATSRSAMRKGFLMALRKQRKLLHVDPELVALVDAKIAETTDRYRDVTMMGRGWMRVPRQLRARMPWRLRRRFEGSVSRLRQDNADREPRVRA